MKHSLLEKVLTFVVLVLPSLPALPSSGADSSIGFIETFALAEDRREAVAQLIPGTEDFYYFSALLAQQEGRLDDVGQLMEPWRKRHGETARYVEVRNRQALLQYEDDPEKSLDYLGKVLGLQFDHQQQRLDAKPEFPVQLDEDLITWEAFLNHALRRNSGLGEITDRGLDRLIREEVGLNENRRRELLSRINYPDFDRLVGMIAADLRTRSSRGFGSLAAHQILTLEQIDELAQLRPELLLQPTFVNAKLSRMRPSADVSLELEPEVERAHYDRLWEFVSTLEPSFNSLKVAILYRRLDLARASGDYPLDWFLEYLKLPRPMPYMDSRYVEQQVRLGGKVDMNVDFSEPIGCGPIGSDEVMVRVYLEHFFIEDDSPNRFAPYIREDYLKQVLAETKLLYRIGEAERWYSMLSPSQVQALKDRIEIEFLMQNQDRFETEDEVSLSLRLKNVGELIVKVYEVNALNFYLDQQREINTDLNLDGLIPNEERSYPFGRNPVERHVETFVFDSLAGKRGCWVIEFIGNGISSRALIRKGDLQYLSEVTPFGELVTMLREDNSRVIEGSLWLGGKRYDTDEDGYILLPFSTLGKAPVVLSDGEMHAFATLNLPQESYALNMGMVLDQESLLSGREASIAISPNLSLNGKSIPVSLLEEVTLEVTTQDHDGVDSRSLVEAFELFDDQESIHTFRVPSRLARIHVQLSGEVPVVSQGGKPTRCSVSRVVELNGIDQEERVADSHLSRFEGNYQIEVLGKSGEPLPDRAVNVRLRHRDFVRPLNFNLKTDEQGRVLLGGLTGIAEVACQLDGVGLREWDLLGGRNSVSSSLHAAEGDRVALPFPGLGPSLSRSQFALFEVRNGKMVRDAFAEASRGEEAVILDGLKPGDYRAVMKDSGKVLSVLVTKAERKDAGYALSSSRHLQLTHPNPLRITEVARQDSSVSISLEGADATTRVHVFATRYLPQMDPFTAFLSHHSSTPYRISRGLNESLFISGRDIGEEYRYILERRSAAKFPGNLLSRPGLILNPWELSETKTVIDDAEAGEAYERSKEKAEAERTGAAVPSDSSRGTLREQLGTRSLEFLARPTMVLHNLAPNEDGSVSIQLSDLGDRQQLHVLAVNESSTAYLSHDLPEPEGGTPIRELELSESLDLSKNFTQRRNVTLLDEGRELLIEDLRSAELETYDTLGQVMGVLSAISEDPTLKEFMFLSGWPSLGMDQKRSLYSEYACHELNFFLANKDPEFFASVIAPYLENKKDKTFLDHYLLEHDLEKYLQPWRFSRLNLVERILLGRRLGGDRESQLRAHISDLWDLQPRDPELEAMYFRQALRGRRAENTVTGVGGGWAGDAFADPFGAMEEDVSSMIAARRSSFDRPMEDDADGFADVDTASVEVLAPVSLASVPAPRAPGLANGRSHTMGFDFKGSIDELRDQAQASALFRKLEATREWAENNYYELPIEFQVESLIPVNAFWKDFAAWDGDGGFYSREFPSASRNFAEMMFALSVLNLPFDSDEHEITVEEESLKLTARSPVVIFHEEIQEAVRSEEATPILVSQNFFRWDDRYTYVDGRQQDKFVSDEFLTGVVYGASIVVTNPTSSLHRLDVLAQIPEGAIPVGGSDFTRSYALYVGTFSAERLEVLFYFPRTSGEGTFSGYPAQISKGETVIASGEAREFKVVDQLTKFDEASWQFLSQFGSDEEVYAYLASQNLHRIDLSRVAWRAREDIDFFRKATRLIETRHAFHPVLWSYGLYHNVTPQAGEFLKHQEDFLRRCGDWIETELVSVDPVERHWYQHLEFAPVVNARAHQLGRDRTILNNRFLSQYQAFLKVLSYKAELPAEDRLSAAAYLLLQDRIEEGLEWLDSVEVEGIDERLQFDYLRAYAALFREDPETAAEIAESYTDYPVDRWQNLFAELTAKVSGNGVGETDSREKSLQQQSESDLFLDLSVMGQEARLDYRNLEEVTVNYYEMDLEFLFSSKPFVSGDSGQFSYIKPNRSETKSLDPDNKAVDFSIPEEFASKNVLVEVVGDGQTDSVAIYSNSLRVEISPNYGRVRVAREGDGAPLSKTYVKVYARMSDGSVRFFKDGYTDLSGNFDYVSLNTNEIDQVERLSLMLMSEEHGSVVEEVVPPQR
ncbi:MAG: hypothetical protein AAGA96_03780 [Verrucomicrobiota bacterium]